MQLPCTISKNTISVFANGEIYQIDAQNENFDRVSNLLKQTPHDKEEIVRLIKITSSDAIIDAIETEIEGAKIIGNIVYINGVKTGDYFSERLISIIENGYSPTPYIAFMKNLLENPSEQSRRDLFEFLDKNQSPMTEDGYFIAFKRVRKDFKDIYSGTFDNSPGTVVKVDRNQVDPDSNQTCSHGLHVAASAYLDAYAFIGNSKTIAVKVNPRDVVAVPPDYNQRKMRVCEYLSLNEMFDQSANALSVEEEKEFVKSDNLTKVKPKANEITKVFAEKTKESTVFVSSDGRKFAATIIREGVKAAKSVAAFAKHIEIPESTLRGWIKRLPVETKAKLVFHRAGASFTEDDIVNGINVAGSQAEYARQISVPSGTLSGWVKKIRENQE